MNRKVIFDKPTILVDVDKLPKGAIFFVDGEPYMKITEIKDNFGANRNSVHLRSGDLELWENKNREDFDFEYFPNHQNIKIVGD